MDPLSVSTSITALLTLTKDIVRWAKEAKDAPGERRKFIREASVLSGMLNTLVEFINDSDPSDPWLLAIPRLAEKESALDGLTLSLQLLKEKVNPTSRMRKAGQALTWKHVKDDIKDILSRMERLKSLAGIALELDHIQLSRAIQDQLDDVRSEIGDIALGVSAVRDEVSARKKAELLAKICTVDYLQQHRDFIGRHQHGTGEWFLDSSEYRSWRNSSNGTFYCPGVPGAGKTMMAAFVVEQLLRETHTAKRPVVFVYYNYKRQDEQTLFHTMQAFLRQVVSILPGLPKPVEELYTHTPSVEEIKKILLEVLSHDKKLTIVVDALDECREQTRFDLLDFIEELQTEIDVSLLATSRDFHAAACNQIFSAQPSLEIKASQEDLETYVKERAKSLRARISSDLQQQVVQGVVTAASGMFLLAQLLMDSFQVRLKVKRIKEDLQNLPRGLDAYDIAYHDAMERIFGQEEESRESAKMILSLVFCVARPLNTKELQHALAVQEKDDEIDVDNILAIEDICSVCAGLITLDETTHTVRFVHYTTQEYLERHQRKWIPEARHELARRCLWYLSLREFTLDACETNSDFDARCRAYPFAMYAARHGIALLSTLFEKSSISIDHDLSVRVFDLIEAPRASRSIWQIDASCDGRYGSISSFSRDLKPWSGRHKKEGIRWVMSRGLVGLFRLCVEKGFDINFQDKKGMTLIALAVVDKDFKTLNFLLTYNSFDEQNAKASSNTSCLDADLPSHGGLTPLALAALGGMLDLVLLLLNYDKVDPNAKNEQGLTALSSAIAFKSNRIPWKAVRRSLPKTFASSSSEYQNTFGYIAGLRALCASPRVDLNAKDDFGHTPLFYAVQTSVYEPRIIQVIDFLLMSDTVDTEPGLVNIEAASEEVRQMVNQAHRTRQVHLQAGTTSSAV